MRKESMTVFFEIKKSILKGEKKYKGITLPSPQTHGTYTQRNTYANLATQKVFNEYKKLQHQK